MFALILARTAQSASAADTLRGLFSAQDNGHNQFFQAFQPNLGFSFSAEGKDVDAIGRSLRVVSTEPETRNTERITEEWVLQGPIKDLDIVAEVTRLPKHNAAECEFRLVNRGSEPIRHLRSPLTLDLHFDLRLIGDPLVYTLNGETADHAFPPYSWTLRSRTLPSLLSLIAWEPSEIFLGSSAFGPRAQDTKRGGLSSTSSLPFALVTDAHEQSGFFVGLGWSGAWSMSIARQVPENQLVIHAGVDGVDLDLMPSESVTFGSGVLGFFKGSPIAGSNQVRRMIDEAFRPRLGGQTPAAPVYYDTWYGLQIGLENELLKKNAEVAARLGVEYFVVDAGWQAGVKASYPWASADFGAGDGNWEDPPRVDFPALADYVHSKGMQLGAWVEPERAAPGSRLAREHPDWMLHVPGEEYLILNLGNSEAQAWVKNFLDRFIGKNHLNWIRWDFNIDPREYWDHADPSDRKGITQLRYVEGLYSILDFVLERYPNLWLEGCAGGGRRIDFGTLKRSHSYWFSDEGESEYHILYQLMGGNFVLPGSMLDVNIAHQNPIAPESRKPVDRYPEIFFQCLFAGALGLGEDLSTWTPGLVGQAGEQIRLFKEIRKYLGEEYSSLGRQPLSIHDWAGWEFRDAQARSGIVGIFRLESEEPRRNFPLSHLDPKWKYAVEDLGSKSRRVFAGEELMRDGLPVELERHGSKIFRWSRLQADGRY